MLGRIAAIVVIALASASAPAAEVIYTQDIAPMFKERCARCHGADSPNIHDFKKDEANFKKKFKGPRMNSYDELIGFIGWPDTGAIMRRLDDGKASPGGKPGNMYAFLGANDAERQNNLAIFKAWVGEGGWNLNRFQSRGDVPAITKEQLDKLQLKY